MFTISIWYILYFCSKNNYISFGLKRRDVLGKIGCLLIYRPKMLMHLFTTQSINELLRRHPLFCIDHLSYRENKAFYHYLLQRMKYFDDYKFLQGTEESCFRTRSCHASPSTSSSPWRFIPDVLTWQQHSDQQAWPWCQGSNVRESVLSVFSWQFRYRWGVHSKRLLILRLNRCNNRR